MKAAIQLDAYADITVPGTLAGIGAMSKTSVFRSGYVGAIPVRLSLDKMDGRIIPDLTGSAEIALKSAPNSVILPRSAIFEDNSGQCVFVQTAEGWVRKPVQLGLTSSTHATIASGLRKGDVVALQRPI